MPHQEVSSQRGLQPRNPRLASPNGRGLPRPHLGDAMTSLSTTSTSPLVPPQGDSPATDGHLRLSLPAQTSAAPLARHLLAAVLAWRGIVRDDVDKAELVVGELAANAALHGGAAFTLEATVDPATNQLVLVVADFGPSLGSHSTRACTADERGRGLLIVETVAAWTFVEQEGDEWRVTVGIDLAPRSNAPGATRLPEW